MVEHQSADQGTAGEAGGLVLEKLIESMDVAGIDRACMLRESFLPLSYNGVPCSTNYHTIEAIQKYPDRIIGCSNVGPHLIRGVKNAIKELEILHKDYGFKCTKMLLRPRMRGRSPSGYVPVL